MKNKKESIYKGFLLIIIIVLILSIPFDLNFFQRLSISILLGLFLHQLVRIKWLLMQKSKNESDKYINPHDDQITHR